MSNFITMDDYDASIHNEILASITREDNAIVEICEDRAIMEMKSYLSAKYDISALFPPAPATGSEDTRNSLVLMMAIDITIYHLFSIHNPQKMSQIRKDRYDRAVEWLKQVSKGDIAIEGAKRLMDDDSGIISSWNVKSNKARNNYY